MGSWYRKVTDDPSTFADCFEYYENEAEDAKKELSLKGLSLEKHSAELPGIIEHRYAQLQDIEAILEYLNIEMKKLRSAKFKHYLEGYNRDLSARECEKYVDGNEEVVSQALLINECARLRNKFLGIHKGLDIKQWQITNIIKLRVAGIEDATVN